MYFSLIIATLNRADLIDYCLKSIQAQTYTNYEVIVIDQSDNDDTRNVVYKYKFKNIFYKKVSYRGLSKARNEALKMMTGDWFCLIDDDAYYDENYLSNISCHIQNETNSKTIYSGFIWDALNNRESVRYSEIKNATKLTIRQIIRYCPSPAISYPSSIVNDIGLFDEEFGVGARFGAAEETDYNLRAIKMGYQIVYYRDIIVTHPHEMVPHLDKDILLKKTYNYSYGTGAMYKKIFRLYGPWIKLYATYVEKIAKSLIRILMRNNFGKIELKGLMNGKKDYGKAPKYSCSARDGKYEKNGENTDS